MILHVEEEGGQTFLEELPRGPGMVVLRAKVVERTPEGVLVGQGPSEIGGEMDYFLPGSVCK